MLISTIDNIKSINHNSFERITKNEQPLMDKFKMKQPYYLNIKVDYSTSELVIEFTGKILKDNYTQLINQYTIKECLNNINALNICTLDIDSILKDAYVSKIDVSKDIICTDFDTMTKEIRAIIRNYKKYNVQKMNSNLIISKNVQTRGNKLRLTIYDKHRESLLSENKSFINTLSDPEKYLSYFQDKARFELNINSKEKIRKCLNIEHLDITSVLSSTTNPIIDYLNSVCKEDLSYRFAKSLRDYERIQTIVSCNYEEEQIENLVRSFSSPKTHISQAMQPYRELLGNLKNHKKEGILSNLTKLLSEVFFAVCIVVI